MNSIKKIIIIPILIFSLLISTSLVAFSNDVNPSNHENSILSKWVENGIIKGYPDGTYKINQFITRAEFATLLCRIFNFDYIQSSIPLSDVSPLQWYSPSIHQVTSKRIMNYDLVDSNYLFYPARFINYQEATDCLSKAYNMQDLEPLKNKESTSLLTRLDLIMLINQITAELISRPCTYSNNIVGNLIVNTSNVILKDMTISGNLYLSEGIGDGAITLDNVRINGTVYVNGCGENSLLLKNKTYIKFMIVENHISTVRIIASSKSVIKNLLLFTPAILDGPITLSDTLSNKYAIYPSNDTLTTDTTSLPKMKITDPVTNNSLTDTINNNIFEDDNSVTNTIDDTIPENDNSVTDTVEDNIPQNDNFVTDTIDDNIPQNDNFVTDTIDDNIPQNDIPSNDINTDVLLDNDHPVICEPETLIDVPSNIVVDFSKYPALIISWNPDPLVSVYSLSITSSNDSTIPVPLQTTTSIITLESPPDLLTSNTDYSIAITAIFNETYATTTTNLTFPHFKLEESNNGALWAKITNNHKSTVSLLNFNLGIYEQDIYTGRFLTGTPAYTFKINNQEDAYLIDTPIKNDVTYTLKTLGSYTEAETAHTFCSYDATYFANINYYQLIASTPIGNTESTPIELASVRHLNNLSSFVAAGNTTKNKYFKLLNDLDFFNPLQAPIDATTTNFRPIGINKDTSPSTIGTNIKENKPFEGNFDGTNYIISNMNIYISEDVSSPSDAYLFVGLFAFITGNIKNITLDSSCNITVNSKNNIVGGIVACANYIDSGNGIFNCYNYASINASVYAAGIVGVISTKFNSSNSVMDCYNYGTVTSDNCAAGIINILSVVDSSTINITRCNNFATIKAKTSAGGIISQSVGSGISNIGYCNNFGQVSTQKETYLFCIANSAGIISYASNTLHVTHCLNGGLITTNANAIRNLNYPSNAGKIHSGGIIGNLISTKNSVSYNYNYGDVSSTLLGIGHAYSGGILANPAESQTITHCYTLSKTPRIPNNSQDILFVSYEEFINSINETLSHLTDYIKAYLPTSM